MMALLTRRGDLETDLHRGRMPCEDQSCIVASQESTRHQQRGLEQTFPRHLQREHGHAGTLILALWPPEL